MLPIRQETKSLITRDGIRLDADIYRPDTKEELPILLMRQPYGKAIASTVVYAHPKWYAAQGYIVVIQDVRGRGTSEGEFKLFANEVNDGIDTIDWLSQLPGSTGEIGMYGFSYQGMTQLYAAVGKSSCLKAIAPAMIAYDLYTDWAYENGAFCLYANLGWAIQLAAETARLKGDEIAYQQLYQAARNLPLYDPIPALPEVMTKYAPDSFYHDWLNYSEPGTYWQEISPKYLLQDVDLPMLHIGGWFDPYLRGTLNLYDAMSQKSQHPQHLIVAPWAHLPWGSKLGAKDYGIEARNCIDEIQIRWFDYFLKGKDTGILNKAPISLFEMGSNCWIELEQFPQQNTIYSLASEGLAATQEGNGVLWEYQTKDNHNNSLEQEDRASSYCSQKNDLYLEEHLGDFPNTEDIIVHDPWRPVPALGGHASFPGGSFDRSNLDCRSDILTYTSAPLETDLYLAGSPILEVYCSADRPSFDLCAILSEISPDGQAFNFSQGYCKVKTTNNPVKITLQATCIKLTTGNSLRLSLSAACFPAYPVNSGLNKPLSKVKLSQQQIITITMFSGANSPTSIKLRSRIKTI